MMFSAIMASKFRDYLGKDILEINVSRILKTNISYTVIMKE